MNKQMKWFSLSVVPQLTFAVSLLSLLLVMLRLFLRQNIIFDFQGTVGNLKYCKQIWQRQQVSGKEKGSIKVLSV